MAEIDNYKKLKGGPQMLKLCTNRTVTVSSKADAYVYPTHKYRFIYIYRFQITPLYEDQILPPYGD